MSKAIASIDHIRDCAASACERTCDESTCHINVKADDQNEVPICWICLSSDVDESPLERCCSCPSRFVHRQCLAQWQIVSAGKSEEEKCRFCEQILPDWRECLVDKPQGSPVMTVTHNGQHHVLKVESGEHGRHQFEQQIRDIYGLGAEDNISVTFGIKEPFSGSDVTLEGWGAWRAAVECAACSAGSRSSEITKEIERLRWTAQNESATEQTAVAAGLKGILFGCLQIFLGPFTDDDDEEEY